MQATGGTQKGATSCCRHAYLPCTSRHPSLLTSSLMVMGMRKAGCVVVTLTRTVAFWERAKEIGPVPGPVLSYGRR